MKIIVPTISMVHVGWGTTADRIYYSPNRPNQYGREFKIVEPQLGTKVVFDRDLKIARRATAAGQLVALAGIVSVALPVYAVFRAAELVQDACNWFGEHVLTPVEDATGLSRKAYLGTVGAARALVSEIVR